MQMIQGIFIANENLYVSVPYFPERICKSQFFKGFKHGYLFPGWPTNNVGIAINQKKFIKFCGFVGW